MHSVMYNPVEPRLLATANAKEGVGLWDVRKPKRLVSRLFLFLPYQEINSSLHSNEFNGFFIKI